MLRSWTTDTLPSAVVTDAAETIGASFLCLIKAKYLSKRDQVDYSAPRTLVEFIASGLAPALQWLGLLGPQSPQTLANISKSGCCRHARHGLVTAGWTGLASLPNSAIPNTYWSYFGGVQHLELMLQYRQQGHSQTSPPPTNNKNPVTLHLQRWASALSLPLTPHQSPSKSVDTPVA